MQENITYGECLSEIIKALGIKSNKLAREINIDPSLVYKWLRNERVPSYDSPYIDLTLNFISKRIFNPSQRAALAEVLAKFGIGLSEQSDANLLKALQTLLQFSQGYSIRLHIKKKTECKLASTGISSVAGFIKKIDIQTGGSDAVPSERDGPGRHIRSEDVSNDTDHVQIIRGRREVLRALTNFLTQAPRNPLSDSNEILMTINSDLGLLGNDDINSVWIQKLHDLLSGGWKLVLHVTLDHNVGRTIKIIGNIEKLLMTGNL